MYSGSASSRIREAGLVIALLGGTTLGLRPLEVHVVGATVAGPQSEQISVLSGHGGILGVLGGMRAAMASACWLEANLAWERRDPVATTHLIELTVAADERPVYFWLNGARIFAYDFPAWSLPGPVPAAVRRQVVEKQAAQALHFLEKGLRWHGPDAALYVEMANIHLRCRGDIERAAWCYRQAAEQPGAPYYAGRIHGELLRQLGRPRDALAWLRQLLVRLPVDDPAAARGVVAARIRELEEELGEREAGGRSR